MTPRQYEELVSEHFVNTGYVTEITPYGGDYGVDLFATKGKQKIAIQSKMYGANRKINRQMVMELHGAKDYFNCTQAITATDGQLMDSALEVAKKLNIEILFLEVQKVKEQPQKREDMTFDIIWKSYIIPLEGKTLTRGSGKDNQITKVNWAYVERITSTGKPGKIKIEIFKLAIYKLLKDGRVTRDFINQNYVGRASSGVILILSSVPFFLPCPITSGLIYKRK
jgi:hypothetical protein